MKGCSSPSLDVTFNSKLPGTRCGVLRRPLVSIRRRTSAGLNPPCAAADAGTLAGRSPRARAGSFRCAPRRLGLGRARGRGPER